MKKSILTVFKYCLTTAFVIIAQFSSAIIMSDEPIPGYDKLPPPTKTDSYVIIDETNEIKESKLFICILTIYDEYNQTVYQEDFDANTEIIIPDWVLEDNTYTWTITYTQVDSNDSLQ